MSLYANDVSPTTISVEITSSRAASVASLVLRYVLRSGIRQWTLTPTSTTSTKVYALRLLQAGDVPDESKTGYLFRAWAYDSGSTLLFTTDEFRGPKVEAQRISPP